MVLQIKAAAAVIESVAFIEFAAVLVPNKEILPLQKKIFLHFF